jgi:hypothetical protein
MRSGNTTLLRETIRRVCDDRQKMRVGGSRLSLPDFHETWRDREYAPNVPVQYEHEKSLNPRALLVRRCSRKTRYTLLRSSITLQRNDSITDISIFVYKCTNRLGKTRREKELQAL